MAFVSLLRCIECKIESLEGPPSHPVLPCFTVHRLLVACTHVYVTKCTTLLHCTSTPASISLYLAMHLCRSHWHSSILHPEQREIWNWIERNSVLRCACVILHIWFRKYWQTPDVHIFNDSRLMLINWFWWLIELELVAINREWESRQFWAFSRFAMTEHFESTCSLLTHNNQICFYQLSTSISLGKIGYILVFGGVWHEFWSEQLKYKSGGQPCVLDTHRSEWKIPRPL